jgi:hypothetical protein
VEEGAAGALLSGYESQFDVRSKKLKGHYSRVQLCNVIIDFERPWRWSR